MKIKILIINDNFEERFVLKELLVHILRDNGFESEIFTSSNGIQGLGFLFVIKPDFLIIDTIIPEFSGSELLDILKTNNSKIEEFVKVKPLLLGLEDSKIVNPLDYTFFSIHSESVGLDLVNFIRVNFAKSVDSTSLAPLPSMKLGLKSRLLSSLGNRALFFSNKSDHLASIKNNKYKLSFLQILQKFFWKFYASIFFFLFFLISGYSRDKNISQGNLDLFRYRVTFYPSFFIAFLVIVFLIIQFYAIGFGSYHLFEPYIPIYSEAKSEKKANIQIYVRNFANLPIKDAKVIINDQEKYTNASGLLETQIDLSEERNITVTKFNSYTTINITKNSNQRVFNVVLNVRE